MTLADQSSHFGSKPETEVDLLRLKDRNRPKAVLAFTMVSA